MSGDERDDGVTLVELLVVMVLLGVIGAVMLSGVFSGLRAADQVEAEADALGEVRIAVERMSRDLREARSVEPSSTGTAVVLWVDGNADYRQSPEETLTWLLEPRPGGAELVRRDAAGRRRAEALSFVTAVSFAYEPAPPATRTVSVVVTYRVDPSTIGATRTAQLSIRLRNVP